MSKHLGPHHGKKAPHAKQSGGNLHLPEPKQSIHVKQQKDHMAKNVSNHLGNPAQMGPKQPIEESSGKGLKKKMSKY